VTSLPDRLLRFIDGISPEIDSEGEEVSGLSFSPVDLCLLG